MSTWIYILIGIIIIGYFVIRKIKRAGGTPVLKTKIGTEDGFNYKVEFEKLHPETKEIEYVRLVLNYVAKILFVIEKKNNYISEEILEYINNVSQTEMSPKIISESIPSEIFISEGKVTGKTIEGILYFKDMRIRNIMTKLPVTWFEYQLSHSVIALIKVTIDKLDDFHREYLKNSLNYMSESYNQKGINPREMKSMITLPNEAFLSRYM